MRFCFDEVYYMFEFPHSLDKPVISQPFKTRRSRRWTIITETKIFDGIKHRGNRHDKLRRRVLGTADGILVFNAGCLLFCFFFFFLARSMLSRSPSQSYHHTDFFLKRQWSPQKSGRVAAKRDPWSTWASRGLRRLVQNQYGGGLAVGKKIQCSTDC